MLRGVKGDRPAPDLADQHAHDDSDGVSAADGTVVKPCNCHVLGHRSTGFGKRGNRADGHGIVRGNDGRRRKQQSSLRGVKTFTSAPHSVKKIPPRAPPRTPSRLRCPISIGGRCRSPALEAMKRWRCPVRFLMGESETEMAHLVSDSLSRRMPNARKMVIPAGGHGVHFDEPERFNGALMVLLRDVQQCGPRPRQCRRCSRPAVPGSRHTLLKAPQ